MSECTVGNEICTEMLSQVRTLHRCAFCMISPATWGPERMGKSYRVRSMEKVFDDLILANKQTGAKAFNFANDILPPKSLFEIGERLKNSGLPFTWDSEIRLDRGLSSLTQFSLERGSIVYQNPERFGVTIHPLPDLEDLAWTYAYTRTDGIDVNQTTQLFEEIEGALDQSYPDRDLFFKGGLGHAHTTLYTRRYAPETFCRWNEDLQRNSSTLENGMILRTSKGLSFFQLSV